MKKAIIVLSGGLDSSTCAFIAKENYDELYAITFSYGQKHSKELDSARAIGLEVGVKEHRFVQLPTPSIGSLTTAQAIPESRNIEEMSKEIPSTYVPARNTLFIAYALQFAEEVNADAIYVGLTAMDYSGYPDCRPEYVRAWQNLINEATKKTVQGGQIKLETPLLHLYKAEIIEWGTELGVPYNLTHSCYQGGEKACGKCDSCLLRLKGFKEAGKIDPLTYQE